MTGKKKMSNMFFTSDSHFFHTNIIKFCGRPFSSTEEMNEQMIQRWNSVVRNTDEIYHLGDFSFGDDKKTASVIRRLNGNKHLILGNHDYKRMKKEELKGMFNWVKHYHELKGPNKVKIVLSHYAFEVWNKSHYGSWNLHGHSHGTLKFKNIKRLDVGVDTNNFYPYHVEEIAKIMEKRNYEPPDFHGNGKKD